MRRMSRAVVAAVGVAFLASACAGGGESSGAVSDEAPADSAETGAPARGDADLVIWTDNLKVDAVRAVADTFAKANDITVAVQVVSSDLQTNFVTANTAGNGPDVVVGAHDWIGNLVQNGAIEPLQLPPDQLEGYSELAVQATTYAGKLYGVPYGVEAVALYRNADVVPDEPKTLDDAFAAGQAALQAGQVESAFNVPQGENGDAYHMEGLYTSMGGYLFGTASDGSYEAEDLGVGKEGSIAAARKISELGENGANVLRRSISGDNAIALFTAGKAAFLVSGPWALNDVKTSGINYAIQPLPGFAGQAAPTPFMGAQAFMVASAAENKAFAQEFVVNGVNNVEAMTTMYEKAKLPPSLIAVQEEVADDDPDIAKFAEAAELGAPMPSLPAMAAVWAPLGKAYAAIIGGADPDATMTTTGQTIADAIG